TGSSSTTPQSFVVPAHPFGKLGRHGVAIDRNERIGRFTSAHFLGDSVAELVDRVGDKALQLCPIGQFGVSPVLFACTARPIADSCGFRPQFGIVKQFLNVAHPVGPLSESIPRNGITTWPPRPRLSRICLATELTIASAVCPGTILSGAPATQT